MLFPHVLFTVDLYLFIGWTGDRWDRILPTAFTGLVLVFVGTLRRLWHVAVSHDVGRMGLAKRFGCAAEVVRFRCPSPVWLGDALSGLAMSHWLAIFAIPSALLGAIGLLISGILQHRRSRNPNGPSPAAFTGVVATKSLPVYVRPWRNDGISPLK